MAPALRFTALLAPAATGVGRAVAARKAGSNGLSSSALLGLSASTASTLVAADDAAVRAALVCALLGGGFVRRAAWAPLLPWPGRIAAKTDRGESGKRPLTPPVTDATWDGDRCSGTGDPVRVNAPGAVDAGVAVTSGLARIWVSRADINGDGHETLAVGGVGAELGA